MSSILVRIAIASDLHAISGSAAITGRSHLNASESEEYPGRQPIAGLLKLIDQNSLEADLLICPGDLGDQANPDGIRYAWQALHRIGSKLKARGVIATTGNHDVDSRRIYNNYDPIEVLKDLDPPYPFSSDSLNGQYWMKHFVVCEEDHYRLLALNSSAFHSGSDEEAQRGRVSISTIDKIEKYLQSSPPKGLNIMICHHHPQQHAELKLGDYDWMREGQELLDLIGSGQYGSWLVIHGHKHHPKVTYAAGGLSSAVVFSAGSLSAVLYPELGTAARNQFYLLTLTIQSVEAYGLVGRGQSWDWASSQGWLPASAGSGLPASFGFGCRVDFNTLCDAISIQMHGKQMATWHDIVVAVPSLDFVLPKDLVALNRLLQNRHKLQIIFDKQNAPFQLGRYGISEEGK
jgi:3',5'-cyclic AMP phosphodiesterase CpdA